VDLSGKVVVVPVQWDGASALAAAMAGRGATVVLVGSDGEAAGRLAAAIESVGAGRPAVFVSDGSVESLDALGSYLTELFRPS
jgi:NAD(P)-dependent dehydrogenase (short-subunit alcohol dehydrogenase family)